MAEARGGHDDEPTDPPPPPGLRWWQLVILWVVALGAPAGIASVGLRLVTAELSDASPEGQCEGIGFGCAMSERDGVEFLAVVYGTPVVVVFTGACAVVAGSITAQSRWAEVRWLLLVAVAVAVALRATGRA